MYATWMLRHSAHILLVEGGHDESNEDVQSDEDHEEGVDGVDSGSHQLLGTVVVVELGQKTVPAGGPKQREQQLHSCSTGTENKNKTLNYDRDVMHWVGCDIHDVHDIHCT